MPRRLLALVLLSFAAACGGVDDTGAIKGGLALGAGAGACSGVVAPGTARDICTGITVASLIAGGGLVMGGHDPDLARHSLRATAAALEASDPAGLAERESAAQAEALTAPDEQWTCGWARRDGTRLTLVVEGRVLAGEDLGEPSERWRGEIGGRLVGRWMGAACASLALRWLATGDDGAS